METPANVLVVYRIANSHSRSMFRHVLGEAGAVRVGGNVFELDIEGWQPDDWSHLLWQMAEWVNDATDVVLVWQVVDGRLVRSAVTGRDD